MKKVLLQRAWEDGRATLGMITIIDEQHDPIYTLENPLRKTKEDSRIPAGEYMCSPYSGNKFKNVYIVRDVPDRSGILFHWGNYETDTTGCILVGQGSMMLGKKPAITASRKGFDYLRDLIGENDFQLIVVDVVLPKADPNLGPLQ